MNDLPLLFIVGLTGVGKSTTLAALATKFTLLPNRRALTDDLIIPEMLRDLGREVINIQDRLERFELTARYRGKYKGGVVHALQKYLEKAKLNAERKFVFDNIRGLDECRAAETKFPKARFVFLDAPPRVRLERILGRADSFDRVTATRLENTVFVEHLLSIKGLEEVFDVYELARLEANTSHSDGAILNAATIIVAEQRNYSSREARAYLEENLSPERLLYLDTSDLSLEQVTKAIGAWL